MVDGVLTQTSTVTDAHRRVMAATTCESLFGAESGARTVYRDLATELHEDKHQDNPMCLALCAEAMPVLNRLYAEAKQKMANGVYGAPVTPRATIRTKTHAYTIVQLLASGELSDVYTAVDERETRVTLKIAKTHAVNDLLENEATVLTHLWTRIPETAHCYFPRLLGTALVSDEQKVRRRVNVFESVDDTHTLTAVRAKHPEVSGRHVAWIGSRLFAALAYAHAAGVCHGALNMDHVLVHAPSHRLMLVDWCYAVRVPGRVTAVTASCDYPSEVRRREPCTAATDIFMAAGLLFDLAATVERPMFDVLSACHIVNPARRRADAWAVYDDWQTAIERVYGPKRFTVLEMR